MQQATTTAGEQSPVVFDSARVERLEVTTSRLLDMVMALSYEHMRLLNMLTLMAAQPKEGERAN